MPPVGRDGSPVPLHSTCSASSEPVLRDNLKVADTAAAALQYQVDRMNFCPACSREVEAFHDGPGGRPRARCPLCQALERHRYLAILLQAFRRQISRSRYVLEIAPMPVVARMLRNINQRQYIGIDVDPKADGRKVQVVADLTRAPFPDSTFGTSVCFHVFEHIPDDAAAMLEYRRLITPRGIGFIQNPWRSRGPTEEDPSASPEERTRRFGQADHVRIYGEDFEDRLMAAGLFVRRVHPESVLNPAQLSLLGIDRHPIWVTMGYRSALRLLTEDQFVGGLSRRLKRILRPLEKVADA